MLSKLSLESGGFLYPLLVPTTSMVGPSLCNPSIYVDKNKDIIVNLRNINYVLYHSEKGTFEHSWGPLCYLHQENDQRLATNNIICKLNKEFQIISHTIIDTSFLDEKPMWEFVGLEDGRLVEWENKIFLSGVRRDTTTNGQGRMELSELAFKDNDKVIEKSRVRIPAPGDDNSYCEKNWMPVLDKAYTYVKWTNPTEVVKADPVNKTCETIFLGKNKELCTGDLRGGSQVIPFNNKYIALVHEAHLFKSEAGRKNATYRHRFIVWNKEWELVEMSQAFSFMGAEIEFCCGLAEYEDKLLITFGFQDNSSYLLGMPKTLLGNLLKKI
jgi:predicted GH43/DUF377 family glycosyl hydrolase